MSLESDLFEKRVIIEDQLEPYGFKKDQGKYVYKKSFMNDDFYAVITVKDDTIDGKVFDAFSDEEYTLIHMPYSQGSFSAQVKEEYVHILEDIAQKCTKPSHFMSPQARRIAKIITAIFHCSFTYPYKGTRKEDAVFKDGKIFAIISVTDYFHSKRQEVLNVKVKEDIYQPLLTKDGIYPCYLKNRPYWLSIPLDQTISDDILLELIRYSYSQTRGGNRTSGIKEWIIPSSSDFDIDSYFAQDEVFWRQTTDIHVDDIIYVYVAKPYSSILYKCVATQVNLDNPYESDAHRKRKGMMMHPLVRYGDDEYPLSLLKTFNVRYVRGPRYMPKELSDYINAR